MAKKETAKEKGKSILTSLHVASHSVKTSMQNAKPPKIKSKEKKSPDPAKEPTKKKTGKTEPKNSGKPLAIKAISTRNAIKVIYYLMAADGEVFHSEEEKFDAIGSELDPSFAENKTQIVKECKAQMEKLIDPGDYFDVLHDGIELALSSSVQTEDAFMTPKLLIWNLLTVAYSDEHYDETERRLLKYVVRKLNINKAIFLEMESSIQTLMDLEKELAWIKTTDRPYLKIEAMVNEIVDRKNVVFESVKDLIAL